ncbi:MAG: VPLPA-CTERM sorting domain-containing protein [Pseudomonadota bacterium]
MRCIATAAVLAAGIGGTASALPVEFFGEETSPGGVVTGDPVAARDGFLATLSSGVGTEDFESEAIGLFASLPISFPGSTGSITATLSGSSVEIDGAAGAGRFPTSGDNFVELLSAEMEIEFSSPVSAFGFFGTDIGDIGERLTVTLTDAVTSVETAFDVPHDLDAPSGSLLFWGFVDVEASYSRIALGAVGNDSDIFGFDDMIIGDVEQIVNPPRPTGEVPLPAAAWLMLAGLGALAGTRARARRRA